MACLVVSIGSPCDGMNAWHHPVAQARNRREKTGNLISAQDHRQPLPLAATHCASLRLSAAKRHRIQKAQST
jgi:hypothetical protein